MGESEARADGERSGRESRAEGEADERSPAEGSEEPAGDEAAAARAVEAELEGEAAVTEQLVSELEELRDRHLRLAAEFENYRKRTRQELLKTRELGQAELAARLLDALDDLRRIVDAPQEAATVDALHEGVELVERKILKALAEGGVEAVDAEGERFDPTLHEAISSVPTADPREDQEVAEVFVRGWRLGDRLLRPARVVVKTYQPDAEAGEPDGGRRGGAGRRGG